ncbi:MAG TPA: energy transducer TonB [Niabella sp.]|nr:energy transducer TonB [Niabella sp.]HOZ97118.1 energy transducer TonB [Niabella sp.]HQW15318.1 energy transducer TonB [Niabella sp.]HQX20432.1 energy transducer TonB [Niabella sp.]HQX42475.1 energy transducer TonB [Niabella sp.]
MDANKILKTDFLDLLFEGRNKAYGAYELRRAYNKRLLMALGITGLILLGITGGAILKSSLKSKDDDKVKMSEVTLQNIEQEKPKEEPPPPPPPPPPKQVEPPKIEMKAFTPPKIVKDEEVKEPPPAVEELKDTKIGTINQEGIKDVGIVTPPAAVDAGKGLVQAKPVEKEPEIFTKVEVDAKYPGNWTNYLTRNLDPQVAVDNGASPGNHTVIIQFVVDVEGNVSDVKALSGVGFGMEQEAMRVIKRSGKWTPAIQNGRSVKAYKKQPITFQVTEQ